MNFMYVNSMRLNISSLFHLIRFLDRWKKFNTPLLITLGIFVLFSILLTAKISESSGFSIEFNMINSLSFFLVIFGFLIFLIITNKTVYDTIRYNLSFSINLIKIFFKVKKRIDVEYLNYFKVVDNEHYKKHSEKYKFLISSLLFNNIFRLYLTKLNRKFSDNSQGFTTMKNFGFLYRTRDFNNYYSRIFFDLKHYKEEDPFDYMCFTIKNGLIKYLSNTIYKDCIHEIDIDGLIAYIIKTWYSELNREIIKK